MQILFFIEIVCKNSEFIVCVEFFSEALFNILKEKLQHVHEKLSYLGDKPVFVKLKLICILIGECIVKLRNLFIFKVHDCTDVFFFVLNDREFTIIGKTSIVQRGMNYFLPKKM